MIYLLRALLALPVVKHNLTGCVGQNALKKQPTAPDCLTAVKSHRLAHSILWFESGKWDANWTGDPSLSGIIGLWSTSDISLPLSSVWKCIFQNDSHSSLPVHSYELWKHWTMLIFNASESSLSVSLFFLFKHFN